MNPSYEISFNARINRAGVFTAGADNAKEIKDQLRKMLKDEKKGVWTIKVNLSSGDYEYRFIVDEVWIKDPKNVDSVLNEFGQENSLLII